MSAEAGNLSNTETLVEDDYETAVVGSIIGFIKRCRETTEGRRIWFGTIDAAGRDGSRAIDPHILQTNSLLREMGISVKRSFEVVAAEPQGNLVESRITELALSSDEPGPVIVEKTTTGRQGSYPSKPLIVQPSTRTTRLLELAQ